MALLLAAVLALTWPSAGWAQPEAAIAGATPGWYFIPNVSLTELWDDNVFRTATQREADFITRVTPGFTGGYRSEPFTLLGSFSFDAEIFAEHPELSGAANGKRAGLQITYLPTRNLTLGLGAGYIESETPSTLNTLTNVEQGRTTSTQVSATPTLAYRLTPIMTGATSYSFTSTQASGVTTDTHHGELGLSRQLTPGTRGATTAGADVASLTYGITLTEFSRSTDSSGGTSTTSASSSVTSHTLLPRYTHYFTPLTRVSLQAGPRYEEGAVRPEVNAEISHEGQALGLSLAYFRSESTLVGQTGLVKTQGGRASVRWQPPVRGLSVAFTPSYAVTSSAEDQADAQQDFTVYAATISVSYQLARWLTATAAYQFTRQEQRPDNLESNIASLRFDVVYPVRVR